LRAEPDTPSGHDACTYPKACAAARSTGRELEAQAERDTPSDHTFVPWVTIDGRAVGAECGAPLRLRRGQAWPACSAGMRAGGRASRPATA